MSSTEEKMAYNAQFHASYVDYHITCMETGKIPNLYKAPLQAMLVSLGPKNAISIVNNKVWGSGALLGKMKDSLNKYKIHSIAGCYGHNNVKKCMTCKMVIAFEQKH